LFSCLVSVLSICLFTMVHGIRNLVVYMGLVILTWCFGILNFLRFGIALLLFIVYPVPKVYFEIVPVECRYIICFVQ
jgi:hypothetical protein